MKSLAPTFLGLVTCLTIQLTGEAEALAQEGWDWQHPVPTLTAVSFTDANNGTVVGYDGTILRTTDGGTTWVHQSSGTTEFLMDVCFTEANIGTAVGWNGIILRTTDGGTTWVSQSSGTTARLHDVSFVEVNTGTVVGAEGTILRTTDGGITWVSQPSGTTVQLNGVSFTDENTGTAVGDSGTILRTTDGGVTWLSQASGTTDSLMDVSFTDDSTGTAVGGKFRWAGNASGIILRTTNGGATWVTQWSDGIYLEAVSFTDANRGTAVGWNFTFGGPFGHIIHTTDGGTSWQVHTGEQYWDRLFRDVSFTDAMVGTVVGSGGTILRTTTGGVTGIEEDPRTDRQVPKEFALRQNYPNPFNPSTTIRFDLPHAGYVTLKVYNVLGEEVAALAAGDHVAGTFKATWDASGLPSGVYFYRLTAGEYVQTRKAVLMK